MNRIQGLAATAMLSTTLVAGGVGAQPFGLGSVSQVTQSVPSVTTMPVPTPGLSQLPSAAPSAVLPPRAAAPLSQVCNQQYAPVCGVRGGVRRTYPNDCLARADGADIAFYGSCAG